MHLGLGVVRRNGKLKLFGGRIFDLGVASNQPNKEECDSDSSDEERAVSVLSMARRGTKSHGLRCTSTARLCNSQPYLIHIAVESLSGLAVRIRWNIGINARCEGCLTEATHRGCRTCTDISFLSSVLTSHFVRD